MVLTSSPFFQNQWLWLFALAPLSLILSFYFYRNQDLHNKRLKSLLIILRALALLVIGILLVNPKIKQKRYLTVKPGLTILLDQSQSIIPDDNLKSFYEEWLSDEALNNTFQVQWYGFGASSFPLENLKFDQSETNISSAVSLFNKSFSSSNGPIIVMTDGQQTLGPAYQYYVPAGHQLYPVILGDTVWPQDISIERISANPIVRKGQAFEVELLLNNLGSDRAFETKLSIYQNDRLIKSIPLKFEAKQRSKLVYSELKTEAIGPQSYRWTLDPLPSEKIIQNNSVLLNIESLNDQRKLLLVSEMSHPDIGVLYRGLGADQNTTVIKTNLDQAIEKLKEVDAVIIFEPNNSFELLLAEIMEQNLNTWIIGGPETRWDLITNHQPLIKKEQIGVSDQHFINYDDSFSLFKSPWNNWMAMPPLQTDIGLLTIEGPSQVMLRSNLQGSSESGVQLAFFQDRDSRWIVWDGLGLWRWRLEAYLKENSHEPFDEFIGVLAKYICKNRNKSNLKLDYKRLYQRRSIAEFRAQYIDKTGSLNLESRLELKIIHTGTEVELIRPLLPEGNSYKTGLSDLAPGVYDFSLRVLGTNERQTGRFEIESDKIETGVGYAKIKPMRHWAKLNQVTLRNLTEMSEFKKWLIQQEEFKPREKIVYENLDFIRWYYALALLILLISSEWFIRKYNGLI